jgi:AcrR family transcriptional regulator
MRVRSALASPAVQGRGAQTRRRLLDAAATVFARRGYHAARVDDIVKVAKTSHGTFYLYFENKQALFAALAGEVTERMDALIAEFPPFGRDDAGRAELEAWLARFADLYRTSGPVLQAWTEAEIAGEHVGEFGAASSERLVDEIAERFRSAATVDIDPRTGARAIVAMIERSHYYLLTKQLDVDLASMTATLARVTHAAVYG